MTTSIKINAVNQICLFVMLISHEKQIKKYDENKWKKEGNKTIGLQEHKKLKIKMV